MLVTKSHFETALRKIIFFLFYTKQFQNVTLSPTFQHFNILVALPPLPPF